MHGHEVGLLLLPQRGTVAPTDSAHCWPHDPRAWWLLVALALVAQVGGQGLITYSMAHLPASFASIALLVQPVVAAAVSWVLFDQALGPLQLAGGVLVLGGVTLAGRARGTP